MKTFSTLNRFKKSTALFATLVGTAVLLNSCKNDINQTTPAIAALTVVNAYPTNTALDFYLGNERVNNTGLAFGEKISYFQAYEGLRTAVVTATGTTTPNLVSKSITLKGGIYHSLYVIGKETADVDFILVEDTLTNPAANKVNIRFANLSPDAPALSLELVGDETSFDDLAYKAFTPFKSVNGVKSKFILREKATDAVKATLEDVELKPGKIYTVWAKGLNTSESDTNKLTIKVTEH